MQSGKANASVISQLLQPLPTFALVGKDMRAGYRVIPLFTHQSLAICVQD